MTQEIKPQIKDNGEAGGLPFNLQEGRTYITRTGEKVTMSVDKHCKPASDYHQFRGSNGFYYKTNGVVFDDREYEADIVSEDKEPTKYTETEVQQKLAKVYQDGFNAGNTFSTSELQSLIQMQSKVITEVEREILELKETAAYLSHNSNSRVQELRKKIYNEITSKNKRLVKVVQLQTKMKRNK